MNGKKIFSVFAVAMIAILMLGTMPASVFAAGWTQDVSDPDPNWTPIAMLNNTTDGVWDGANTVTGTTPIGQFDIMYEQWVLGSHFEYADKIVGEEGHWGECPEGYTVDPDNIAQCRKLIADGYWDYKPRIIDVPAHYGDCPAGYDVDPNDEAWCTKLISEGYWDYQPRIVDVPAHYGDCPTDYSVDPGNEAQCRKLITEGYWDYKAKIVDVPAHWGECPVGFEVDPDNPAKCRQLITEGYWDHQCTPGACPEDQVFTASHRIDTDWEVGYYGSGCGINCTVENKFFTGQSGRWGWYHRFFNYEETFTVTFDYGKSSDPHKCHRPTGDSLGVPSWAMNEFNAQFPEWVYPEEVCIDVWIPPVYDYVNRPWIPDTYKCPDGYSENGNLSSQSVSCPPPPLPCKKWIDAVYDYKPRPWIPATYKCPDGYSVDPDDATQCRKYIDAVYDTKPREWIPATYKCPDGYSVDPDDATQCRKYIDAVYDYKPREWIPETYVCPEGYEEGVDPNRPDDCAKLVDDSHMIYKIETFYIQMPPGPRVFPCATCGSHKAELGGLVFIRAARCDGEPTRCENPKPYYTGYWDQYFALMFGPIKIEPTVSTDILGQTWYSITVPAWLTFDPKVNQKDDIWAKLFGFYLVDKDGKVIDPSVVNYFNGACACSNWWNLTFVDDMGTTDTKDDTFKMTVYDCFKNANEVTDFIVNEYYPRFMTSEADWMTVYREIVVPQWVVGPDPVTIGLPKPEK
jgi:hypothetical protein